MARKRRSEWVDVNYGVSRGNDKPLTQEQVAILDKLDEMWAQERSNISKTDVTNSQV